MKPEIINVEPAISLFRLQAAERELGLAFPEVYRSFLLHHNGGQPEPNTFRFNDGKSLEVVGWFFSIDDQEDSLVNLVKIYRPYLHKDLLPIASDPFGNLICVAVSGKHEGQIFFWLHESEHAPETPIPHTDCRFVAASFDAFMNTFEEYK
jgi:cell wall assembly regulator SMI1